LPRILINEILKKNRIFGEATPQRGYGCSAPKTGDATSRSSETFLENFVEIGR